MTTNSIVIICDDIIVAKALRLKLATLREVDSIKIATFRDAVFEIESNAAEVVMVFAKSTDKEVFSHIDNIRPTAQELNAPILLVTDELTEDFVVSAFDAGVDDFVSLKASEGELITRIILCMKKNELLKEVETKNKLLTELNVLQEASGFYLKEYAKKVFETEINNLQKYGQSGVLAVVSADVNCKLQLSPSILGSIIRRSTRSIDIIGFYCDDKFYMLLAKTGSKGAIEVYDRIKKELVAPYTVSVGACEIDNLTFEEIDKNVTKAINEALELGNSIVIADTKENEEPINWLDKETSAQKNFKFFKQAFLKKLENVIAPVFYQTQKIWEDRLFNTKIEQFSDENQSMFILKHGENKSVLKITYPGFAKINIDASHEFEGSLPKDRISLDLTELDETRLGDILIEFIKEYQTYVKD